MKVTHAMVARERPVLFSGPMVRAILDGTKTQTRRLMPQPETDSLGMVRWRSDGGYFAPRVAMAAVNSAGIRCQHGQPGDKLWVRERWSPRDRNGNKATISDAAFSLTVDGACNFRNGPYSPGLQEYAPGAFDGIKWRPSIHMPRWASRITLEVTDVRVERLQDISDADARAEGVAPAPFCKAGRPAGMEHVEAFECLWDSINADRAAWSSNPWVWAISFKRVSP